MSEVHIRRGIFILLLLDTNNLIGTSHKFSKLNCDWGFTKFMNLSDLHGKKGYLSSDTLIIVEIESVTNNNVKNQKSDGNDNDGLICGSSPFDSNEKRISKCS